MVYLVGLVEYGHGTHIWHYHDYSDALHQLRLLCETYDEVNETRPVLLKLGQHEADMGLSLDTLLKQYSITPKTSPH